MKIDAHQHYWEPERGDYGWMPKDNPILYRTYGPDDLAPHLKRAGIDGTIVVQAAPTVAETEYLLDIAENNETVKGVVGWIDFEDPSQISELERLSARPKFKGVRPMIQDIEDDNWMLRRDLSWALDAIIDHDLTFDALGLPKHLPNFLILSQRYPKMRLVIDHAMKPAIREAQIGKDAFSQWASGMSDLANKTGAYCKMSGLITEAADNWTASDLKPFTDHILHAFGPERVMWGSDWPVCRLRSEYDDWVGISGELTKDLTETQRRDVFGRTACRFYRISDD